MSALLKSRFVARNYNTAFTGIDTAEAARLIGISSFPHMIKALERYARCCVEALLTDYY
jgi:hypothetical protein